MKTSDLPGKPEVLVEVRRGLHIDLSTVISCVRHERYSTGDRTTYPEDSYTLNLSGGITIEVRLPPPSAFSSQTDEPWVPYEHFISKWKEYLDWRTNLIHNGYRGY